MHIRIGNNHAALNIPGETKISKSNIMPGDRIQPITLARLSSLVLYMVLLSCTVLSRAL